MYLIQQQQQQQEQPHDSRGSLSGDQKPQMSDTGTGTEPYDDMDEEEEEEVGRGKQVLTG